MMYGKAMCFHDETIAKQILQTDDVTRIKELGRLVSNYNDQIWSGMRQIIVYEGLVEKFSQNQELSDALLNTGDAFLAECAVKDKVWGIGLSMTDPKRLERTEPAWLCIDDGQKEIEIDIILTNLR